MYNYIYKSQMNLEQPAIARHHDALLVPLRHTLDARTQWVELLDAQLAAPSLERQRARCDGGGFDHQTMVDFTTKNGRFHHQKWWISPS